MVNKRQRLRTMDRINQQSTSKSITGNDEIYNGIGLMFKRLVLPKKSTPPFHTRHRRKFDYFHDKASNRSQRGLTMTINTGRLQQTNQQSKSDFNYFRSFETRICWCYCCSWSAREDIDAQSSHGYRTRLSKCTIGIMR